MLTVTHSEEKVLPCGSSEDLPHHQLGAGGGHEGTLPHLLLPGQGGSVSYCQGSLAQWCPPNCWEQHSKSPACISPRCSGRGLSPLSGLSCQGLIYCQG